MITTGNICHLEGVVQGENWTRWKPNERGQVRFWLGVSRDLAGEGLDVLLCAIEPKTVEEVTLYERELRAGRTVQVQAAARSLAAILARPQEDYPVVIFVAESCGFDGGKTHGVHDRKHVRPTGKMAAAGDDSGAELPLEAGKS